MYDVCGCMYVCGRGGYPGTGQLSWAAVLAYQQSLLTEAKMDSEFLARARDAASTVPEQVPKGAESVHDNKTLTKRGKVRLKLGELGWETCR